MKVRFQDGHGQSKVADNRGVSLLPILCPWPTLVLLETPVVAGTITEAVLSIFYTSGS